MHEPAPDEVSNAGTAGPASALEPRAVRPGLRAPDAADELATADAIESFRGTLFTDLDRLAFALEIESADALEAGDEEEATRWENVRLGVRLAQRLVSGVHADEVDQRLERIQGEFERRVNAPVG